MNECPMANKKYIFTLKEKKLIIEKINSLFISKKLTIVTDYYTIRALWRIKYQKKSL